MFVELERRDHFGFIRGILILFVVKFRLSFDKGEQVSGIVKKVLPVLLEELVLEGGLEVVMLHLVEAIHVELPHKTIHLLMPEIARQDNFLKLHDVFNHKLLSIRRPVNNLLILLNLHQMG